MVYDWEGKRTRRLQALKAAAVVVALACIAVAVASETIPL